LAIAVTFGIHLIALHWRITLPRISPPR
jgi:hypothetical protein